MTVVRWITVAFLTLSVAGCHQALLVTPSLGPMDASKQRSELPRQVESACTSFIMHAIPSGGDPLVEATTQLTSTANIDGHVEVTVERATYFWLLGHTTCTTVSGTPFRYGKKPPKRTKRSKPAVRTAAAVKPATPKVECTFICERFGKIMETNQMLQRSATQRCNSRCARDSTFQECVTKASTSRAAKFCESVGR
jgi:hypothetical protein